jgi:hypothetical protein
VFANRRNHTLAVSDRNVNAIGVCFGCGWRSSADPVFVVVRLRIDLDGARFVPLIQEQRGWQDRLELIGAELRIMSGAGISKAANAHRVSAHRNDERMPFALDGDWIPDDSRAASAHRLE